MMEKMVCVTNRNLVTGDYLEQLHKVAKCHPKAIVLREKDLYEEEYKKLALEVKHICKKEGVTLILHYFKDVALELKSECLQVPLSILKNMSENEKQAFSLLGTSIHSLEDAILAQQLGASYIVAGHIFATDCKKGLPPRGLHFLEQVCQSVTIPVYAIGGINEQNLKDCLVKGAKGGMVMSRFMKM